MAQLSPMVDAFIRKGTKNDKNLNADLVCPRVVIEKFFRDQNINIFCYIQSTREIRFIFLTHKQYLSVLFLWCLHNILASFLKAESQNGTSASFSVHTMVQLLHPLHKQKQSKTQVWGLNSAEQKLILLWQTLKATLNNNPQIPSKVNCCSLYSPFVAVTKHQLKSSHMTLFFIYWW